MFLSRRTRKAIDKSPILPEESLVKVLETQEIATIVISPSYGGGLYHCRDSKGEISSYGREELIRWFTV